MTEALPTRTGTERAVFVAALTCQIGQAPGRQFAATADRYGPRPFPRDPHRPQYHSCPSAHLRRRLML